MGSRAAPRRLVRHRIGSISAIVMLAMQPLKPLLHNQARSMGFIMQAAVYAGKLVGRAKTFRSAIGV
jgi:hypothetical protein